MEKFHETFFLKSDSSLDNKLYKTKQLKKCNKEELYMLKQGVAGEKQVEYHLKKSTIGMYALRDINFSCDNLTAQVDFIIVTTKHCYFIECKNYNADIIRVDENSNFELSTKYGRKYKKIGIASPISQVEDQLTVFKKICLNNEEKTKELLKGIRFKDYFKTLVVFTNPKNRFNLRKTPYSLKNKILKVDNLVRQIEIEETKSEKQLSQTEAKAIADFILDNNVSKSDDLIVQKKDIINNNGSLFSRIEWKKVLLSLFLFLFAIGIYNYYYGSIPLISSKKLTEKQKEAIEIYKRAYTNSVNNGFDIISTSACNEMSKMFGNRSFDCNVRPLEVNVKNDNTITFYKNFVCYTMEISSDENSIVSLNRKNLIYGDKNECSGVAVGNLEWDESNIYYQKIGGYEKIKEMAIYSYVNNAFVHDYYDYSHIEERGGTQLWSIYMMNVDMYFSALTDRGYSIKASSTNKEETNKMCESFYYIMK